MPIYGVVRISTQKQNMQRQIRNIKAAYPNAIIIKEVYTGTKLKGRKEFEQLISHAKSDDTFVFDSVSRMCRNADEGCELYEQLFYRGITLLFLQEPHINTDVFKQALNNQIELRIKTGNQAIDKLMNTIIDALNKFTLDLAKQQIRELSKSFNGNNTDVQVMKITGLSKNTYYKYKKELYTDIPSGNIP